MAENLNIEPHKGNKTFYAQAEMKNEEWFKALVEECSSLITETVFNARWTLIEGYHQLGKLVLEEKKKHESNSIYGRYIVQGLAESLGKDRRTIYYAIQFAEKYPDINQLPGGKNISWGKICNQLIPHGKFNESCRHLEFEQVKVCKNCKSKIQ